MNATKLNESISVKKRYRRMLFYLIEKHMQKFTQGHLKVTYVTLTSHSIIVHH